MPPSSAALTRRVVFRHSWRCWRWGTGHDVCIPLLHQQLAELLSKGGSKVSSHCSSCKERLLPPGHCRPRTSGESLESVYFTSPKKQRRPCCPATSRLGCDVHVGSQIQKGLSALELPANCANNGAGAPKVLGPRISPPVPDGVTNLPASAVSERRITY